MSDELPEYSIEELELFTGVDLDAFDNDVAVDLGLLGVQMIRENDANLCVQVAVGDAVAFRAYLKFTGPDNDEWLAGKAAVVREFSEPSLLVRRRQEAAGPLLRSKCTTSQRTEHMEAQYRFVSTGYSSGPLLCPAIPTSSIIRLPQRPHVGSPFFGTKGYQWMHGFSPVSRIWRGSAFAARMSIGSGSVPSCGASLPRACGRRPEIPCIDCGKASLR